MDFKRLQYFCTIVEQGQISRAAQVLHMSQPPLSQRLRELEDELGTPLIIRNGKRWDVTEAGAELYKRAQSILYQMKNLAEDVKSSAADIKGEVRIGVSARCLSFFLRILPVVEREYAGIVCRLVSVDSPTLERYLLQREIDFAVMLLPVTDPAIEIVRLQQQHFVAVFSNLLPSPPKRAPLPLEDIAPYPLLIPRRWKDSAGFRPFILAMQQKNLRPRILVDTQASYILIDALQNTPAVAIVHNTEITKEQTARYPVRKLDLPNVRFNPAITFLKDTYLPIQAQTLINLILRGNA